ncbi:hypothetical protein [Frankia sp. Cj3]|uniref:hypothetical protein n=1 Tax=Frankia sp. Cj3 TaxID=2880976 RepID=UPI001EF7395E|nr:hypothetical protein [Frankia sp. Cj3]
MSPWRGPVEPGEYPTLGYLIGDWVESHCVIPDGVDQGAPYRLTDEMWRLVLQYYRLHPHAEYDRYRPSAPFVYRGGQLMRPQKWGKGPFAAALCLAEAFGPVRFAGWDAAGEPVGEPQPTPWIQIVATSEEQTDNTWLALLEMARRGDVASMPGVDIGVEDINLPGGGKVEPRTAAGRARLGARLTFALFDESGLMTDGNGGVLLATTMRRNIGGMGGRWLETTNAYDPSENSIAQRTQESRAPGILIDYRPPRRVPDLDDDEGMLAELRYLYESSWWVDPERILADCRDESVCPTAGEAYRFFLNHPTVGETDAVDATRWDAQARPSSLEPGDRITLGFDGSRSVDCTSIVASRLDDGRLFHLRTWDPADYPDGTVPRDEVNQTMQNAFDAYEVFYLFGDPYLWFESFDVWAARWGDRVVQVPTNVETRMDRIISRFQSALRGGLTHNGDPILTAHVRAAALAKGRRRPPRPDENPSVPHFYQRVVKKKKGIPIDALIAGLLAESGRGQAIEDGALTAPTGDPGVWIL